MQRFLGQGARLTLLAPLVTVGMMFGATASAGAAEDIAPPVDYGTIGSGDAPFATASNTAGVVVGAGDLEGKDRAYRFFPDSPPQPLGEPAGFGASAAWDVNESGVVVGTVSDPSSFVPAIWVPSSAPDVLPTPAGYEAAWPFAINDAGVVVGMGEDTDAPAISAVLWPPGDPPVFLDPLGSTAAVAFDVNNSGVAVGYAGSLDENDPFTATYWKPGEAAVAIPTLGGTQGLASGINDAGQVVGISTTAGDAEVHLFRWTETGGIEDLGVPPGAQMIMFADNPRILGPKINNLGQVDVLALVGGQPSGFLWTKAEGFTRLPAFAGAQQVSYPLNIDDARRIAGVAISASNEPVAAVWQIQQSAPPVPSDPPTPPTPPGPNAGGGAGSDPTGGWGANGGVGATGTGSLPTLPATGPGTVPVLLGLAAVLLVAGGVLAAGGGSVSDRVLRRVRAANRRARSATTCTTVTAAVLTVMLLGAASAAGAGDKIAPPLDYGTLPPGDNVDAPFATASNAAGVVVGTGDLDGDDHAFRFFPDAPPQPLGEPAGFSHSAAFAVNAAGVVVGRVSDGVDQDEDVTTLAGIWVPDSAPATLPPVKGTDTNVAFDVNDSNTAVGFAEQSKDADEADTPVYPVMWQPDSGPVVLDSLGHTFAAAVAVNNAGVAVGFAGTDTDGSPISAVIWEPGKPARTLPGLGGTHTIASDIDDTGRIVGLANTASSATLHLVRWTDAGIEDLGAPADVSLVPFIDAAYLIAPRTNDHGQVALAAFIGAPPGDGPDRRAAEGDERLDGPDAGLSADEPEGASGNVWTDDEGFRALPPFSGGLPLSFAFNIDDTGRVVGVAASGPSEDEIAAAVWEVGLPALPQPVPAPDPDVPDGGGPASAGAPTGVPTGAAPVPTLPATGPGLLSVLLASAAALLVAGAVLATGVSRCRRLRQAVPRNRPVHP